MTPAIYEEVIDALKREPLPLNRVHALVREGGSSWTEEQVHLFLICMDGVDVDASLGKAPTVRLGQRTEREELVDAIVQVVRSQNKPLPAAQIRSLLPGRFVTTEAQIKALAKETPGLEVFGPGLIRYKD